MELVRQVANEIAKDRDTDVILYNGDIAEPWDRGLTEICNVRPRRKNVLLVLVTFGGDPHAAYRIARRLEGMYERFTAFLIGPCKSAGTLLVTGAHELVVSDQGELGPLDMQMRKTDELWEMNSGLIVMEAMQTLQHRAYSTFEDYFLSIIHQSSGRIGFRTATEVASELVVGLYAPLYAQIDPMLLGQASRAMQIASDYATRLNRYSKNLQEGQHGPLVAAFSDHGFVIDREEAGKYFVNVRQPDDAEQALDLGLRLAELNVPLRSSTTDSPITILSDGLENEGGDADGGDKKVSRASGSRKGTKARPATRRSGARTNGNKAAVKTDK